MQSLEEIERICYQAELDRAEAWQNKDDGPCPYGYDPDDYEDADECPMSMGCRRECEEEI